MGVELTDFIPLERVGAIKAFEKAGFIKTNIVRKEKVFHKESTAMQFIMTKEMYQKRKSQHK